MNPATMVPCIIPFGENIVMKATGLKEGKAFVVVRAVGDDHIGGAATDAWVASEANAGPAWFLSFATPQSCRSLAEDLAELATALEQHSLPAP